MAAVVFDVEFFKNRYRAYAAVDTTLLAAMFIEACAVCDNSDSSVITDVAVRGVILHAIVAHIYELSTTPLVGRVGDLSNVAGIGSHMAYVNASNGSQAWFDQTPHGAKAWAMMAPYRSALYIAPESW